LTKSAIFFAVGHIAQAKGTQKIADMGGLTETNPVLGWGLVLGVVAIAGLPPLGIFMSEFLLVSSTFARQPLLGILLVAGLLIGFGALFLRLNSIAFGEPRGASAEAKASYVPMFTHLALVFAAGVYLPPQMVTWFQIVVVTIECRDGKFPSVGQVHPPAIRLERAIQDLYGLESLDLRDRRPWLDHDRFGVKHPLGAHVEASPVSTPYQFLPSVGESLH